MKKKELRELIHSDLYRYKGYLNKKIFIKSLIRNPGFKYTFLLRICQYYKKRKFSKIQYYMLGILLNRYKYKFGYEIPINTTIGKGIYINHFGSITINEKAIIGNNVNLTKGVTIGQTNRGGNKGVPEIGDKVWIGANATIVGNVKIGNNVLIAPNSYVNFNVPDNSIVIGNPGKIIKSEKATKDYINNIV